jgi:Tol biopolymer transport system component
MRKNMLKIRFIFFYSLIISLALSSCSIQLDQGPATPANGGPGFLTATLPPRPADSDATPAPSVTSIPVTWADLHLSGRLVYTTAQQEGNLPSMDIRVLDLATGQVITLFRTPPAGTIYIASVSPDASQMIFAYSLPPGADGSAHQELYIMPLDGSKAPQLFLPPPTKEDEYLQPDWSSDGKMIYFAHVNYQTPPVKGQHYPIFELYRMAYPNGSPQKLADQAFWPRLADDMSRLAYVSLDPMTGKSKLYLANADGSNVVEIAMSGAGVPDTIDAPLFSPDGKSLLFSAPLPEQAYQPASPSWIEKLLGMTVALAHAVPSEWWSVPLTGGTPTQITNIHLLGLFGSVSPDKKYVASYSGDGIFIMNPDGSGLTMLVKDVGGMPGTLSRIK